MTLISVAQFWGVPTFHFFPTALIFHLNVTSENTDVVLLWKKKKKFKPKFKDISFS